MKGKRPRGADIDRGVTVISNAIRAGRMPQPVTAEAQAAACGVSKQRMQQIFEKARRKVRNAWKYYDKKLGKELEDEMRSNNSLRGNR